MSTIRYVNMALEIFGALLSFILILGITLGESEKTELNRKYLNLLSGNIVLLLFDAVAWFLKGNPGELNYYMVRIANFWVFIMGYVLMALFTDYLVTFLSARTTLTRIASKVMWALCGVACLLVIISQFNHMYYFIDADNMYRRQDLFWLSQIFGILGMCINAALLLRCRKDLSPRELAALGSYILFPAVAMVIQIFIYGVALLYLASSLAVLCIYMNMQVELARRARLREEELEKRRTELLLSQIQPHFLFNSLASIRFLCLTDPVQAEKAVDNFAEFLRGNLNNLQASGPIPFGQELSHLRSYLEIEQIRYQERLKVVYDLQTEDFKLPSLTVQPIVENAVRYGASRRPTGGTVRISTQETPTEYLVLIEDNGPGFDPDAPQKDGRLHIGLDNVRLRLRYQCDGALLVKSKLGLGTRVTISIPKAETDRGLGGAKRSVRKFWSGRV